MICHYNIVLVHILTPNTFNSWLPHLIHGFLIKYTVVIFLHEIYCLTRQCVPFSRLNTALIEE